MLSTRTSDTPLWMYYHSPLQMSKLRLGLLCMISKDREGRRESARAQTCPPILLPLWEGVWGHSSSTPWICSQHTLKWGGSKHMCPRCTWRGADRCEAGPSPGREEGRSRSHSVLQGLPWDLLPTPAAVPASQIVQAPVPIPYLVCSQQLAAANTPSCSAPESFLRFFLKPQKHRELA